MEIQPIYQEDEELCTIEIDEVVDCDEHCSLVENLRSCMDDRDREIKDLLNINLEREAIYRRAIETYGEAAQINMVFEEMSELQKELCKYLRGKEQPGQQRIKIAEEIADVEIMLEQMKWLFDLDKAVENYKEYKIFRLKQGLDKENNNEQR